MPEGKLRIIVTGGTGLLGRSIVKKFSETSDWETLALGWSRAKGEVLKVDLTDFGAVEKIVASFKPDVILHAAAERRLDVCESDQARSRTLNVEVTRHLAKMAKKHSSWLLFISTDYIFDGTAPPYGEAAKPNPLNEYGRQKFEAGNAARESDWGCGVLRVPLLYGAVEQIDESGPSKILKMILDGKPCKLDNWQIRCPTLVDDIAHAVLMLARHKMEHCGLSGVFHWSGPETMTKFEMAKRMAAHFGLSAGHIEPMAEPLEQDARRPKDATLDVETVRLMGCWQQTPLEKGIETLRNWLPPLLLNTAVQQYAWGRVGSDSVVASFKAAQSDQNDKFVIDATKPYAELWIGTHVNAPSVIQGPEKTLLSDFVTAHPEALGAKTRQVFGEGALPFLLKVLSVRTALSIQAHPDKALAERLHRERPSVYKDPNHKPEMAIALTPFEVMCGFRPVSEVETHLDTIMELQSAIGGADAAAKCKTSDNVLRSVFKLLMEADDESHIKPAVAALMKRLEAPGATLSTLEQAIVRIHGDFPGDRGVLCPYLLNHFTLAPGEAVFLGPNMPHAYLSGNCIECMATSDNVVRAGLTPKLRDCETLVAMLEYESRPARPLEGEQVAPGVVGYYPPVPDFQIEVCTVSSLSTLRLMAKQGPSVGIVTQGDGLINGCAVKQGTAFFLPCGQDIRAEGDFNFSLAGVNRSVFSK